MNLFVNAIEEIRKAGEPVIVYGNAILGKRIQAFLETFGVDIAAVAVDRQYLPAAGTPGKHPLIAIEDCLSDTCRHNYVIAFNPRADGALLKEKLQQSAKRILWYDFGYGANENILYDLALYYSYSGYNKEPLREVESWLCDDASRETLSAFIEQKQTGRFGIYGRHWTPCAYFPDDLITLQGGAAFVDCGAYTGDSIVSFLSKLKRDKVPSYDAIYAFEPMADSYRKLLAATRSLQNCHCFQSGVWDERTSFFFTESGQNSVLSGAGNVRVDVVSIDETLEGKAATFIKMDIEGVELKALRGARNTILRHRPTLAVCIYHKAEDILTIPRFVKKLHPDYKLYMRCHSKRNATELVLYAL